MGGAPDLAAMCADYEAGIAAAGDLDLVMLGLGVNAVIACHEPPADFATRTCPVRHTNCIVLADRSAAPR